jgi:hypothetical protein
MKLNKYVKCKMIAFRTYHLELGMPSKYANSDSDYQISQKELDQSSLYFKYEFK